MRCPLAVALLHHPVLDRRGDTVTTAVTNLDVHDIARTCRTYGVDRYYVVTPAIEQQQLVATILHHWREGFGASYNPDRCAALERVEVVVDYAMALRQWSAFCGAAAQPLLTSASDQGGMPFAAARELLVEQPLLLTLGTGWGLAPQLFNQGWPVLESIQGIDGYNHLPVRAALAIMLDRLLRNY